MALNFSRQSIFPTRSSEEGLCSSIRFARGYVLEECPDNNLGDLGSLGDDTWGFNWELENSCDFRKEKDENGSWVDPVADDIMMTLNFSPWSIFPTLSSEEGFEFADGCAVEGYPDKNLDGFSNDTRNCDWKLENSCDYRKEKDEKGSCDDLVSDDILELLPADPFGMDVSATFTAIAGWFEDFEKDGGSYSHGFGTDEIEVKSDYRLYAGLNLLRDRAMILQPEVDKNGFVIDKELGDGLCDGGSVSTLHAGECMDFSQRGNWIESDQANEFQACTKLHHDDDAGDAHDALFFVLGYLSVRDLLSIERVCRSLRDAVKGDPLLWRSIHIDQPLSDRITDDALVRLTGRAQGTLQCLSLVECLKITDSGLKHIFQSNPGLTKLSVPGCVKLSVEGILFNLKALKFAGAPGIKHLRIGGIYGVTSTHFEELKFLLGVDNHMQPKYHKPRFYRGGHLYVSCDDDRAIDIETCPRCQKLRLVYDCPAESCQGDHQNAQLCRACTLCIARCVHCGRCINNCDYEEMFCLDFLCLDCWKDIINHQERLEGDGASSSSKHTIFHRETTYHFCFMA
ncbi:F-box protein SKIP14 [Malania oleifera]|uniref:F-box protein SKIP14 n=1 Tax=Malania oleifera TaxID=397392 RepID=UPI0025AE6251|nr:F-box protein SKIP14 [Malania oleifera]